MTTILLTRSVQENEELIQVLNQYNFRVISCPLLEYKNLEFDFSNILENYSNIIITSKYAAKLLLLASTQYNSKATNHNAWVVGEISSALLKEAGFKIKYTAKDAQDLIKNLPINIYNTTIYLSANEITKNLPKEIKRQIIYEVNYSNTLQEDNIQDINNGVDYTLLYSLNCAKTLVRLLFKYDLLKKLENTMIIAISLRVANIMKQHFKNVIYAKKKQTAMVELLTQDAKIKNQI